jgi:LysM repeat protein
MPSWKNEEVATEALRGTLKRKPRVPPLYFLAMAILALTVVAGVVLFRKPAELAAASRQVRTTESAAVDAQQPGTALSSETAGAASPASAPSTQINAAAANPEHGRAESAATAPAEVVTLPPVTLPDRSPARAAAHIELRPPVAAILSAESALQAGVPEIAIEFIAKAGTASLDEHERTTLQVMEGRALLAMGKVDDARKKFEPLAFLSAESETGADALLGNYWAQAGTLARCRGSELQQVLRGPDSWGAATAALEEARRAEESAGGNLEELEAARALYQRALDTNKLEIQAEKVCLERLTKLTDRIILDPKTACTTPRAVFYKVESGDVAERIARKHKVNIEQIKVLNRLNDKLSIRVGQVLKILTGDVLYRVDRTRLTGTLYIGGAFIRRFPVGIGPGNATPRGIYTIDIKVPNPDWYYDGKRIPFGDPENILGTRWMGFSTTENGGQGAGLGVHGTAYPESVPGRESKGCVRMLNKDVEELYEYMPQGGQVEIVE